MTPPEPGASLDRSEEGLTGQGTARLGIVLGIIGTVATSGGAAYYGQNR